MGYSQTNSLGLKTKKEIEKLTEEWGCTELKGMLNIYKCESCGEQKVYTYRDTGATPYVILCPKCGKSECYSLQMKVRQPDCIWYRPVDINELKDIAERAYKNNENYYKSTGRPKKEIIKHILKNYVDHYNSGGMFSKKTNFNEEKKENENESD